MKLLIMCEGPNELKIINILLENQKLKFSSDDLLGLVPYHARQIKSSAAVKAALNLYPDEVHVLRIGDGQNEKLEIPSAYKDKITLVEKCWYNPATMIIRLWKTSTATGMTQTMCNAGMSSRTRRSCS